MVVKKGQKEIEYKKGVKQLVTSSWLNSLEYFKF